MQSSLAWLLGAIAAVVTFASAGVFSYGVARLWMLAARDGKMDRGLGRAEARYAAHARIGTPEYIKYLKVVGIACLAGLLAIGALFVARAFQ